jgi:segregation and condensation protein B
MAIEPKELRGALEAILFVATEPVKLEELVEAFPDEGSEGISARLEEIRQTLEGHVSGFVLEQTAGGYRLATGPEHDPTLRRFFAKKGEGRLSLAALETLAIIAYRQPVTAPEISDIRGVNSTGVIRTLLERKMIRVAGRKNVVGSPFLYRTTRDFLVHFGLNDIQDLPRLEEFADLIGENIVDDLAALPTQAAMFDEGPEETAPHASSSLEAAAGGGGIDEDSAARGEQWDQHLDAPGVGQRPPSLPSSDRDAQSSGAVSSSDRAKVEQGMSGPESPDAASFGVERSADPSGDADAVHRDDDAEDDEEDDEEMYEDREGTVESDSIDEQHK